MDSFKVRFSPTLPSEMVVLIEVSDNPPLRLSPLLFILILFDIFETVPRLLGELLGLFIDSAGVVAKDTARLDLTSSCIAVRKPLLPPLEGPCSGSIASLEVCR